MRLLIERQLPRNFISGLLDWFRKCYACVRWGGVYSHFFPILAGVRQGGLLSPLLFAIYMDSLCIRLRSCGLGCRLLDEFFGCLLYADDIVLVTHSVNAMRIMLDICEKFAVDFDIKLNGSKSVAMRIDARFDAECVPLTLSGSELQFVSTIKYLGICITAGKYFKCSMDNVKMKFYRVFNAIYSKCKGVNSELVTVELMKSYCLPFIMYATEALPLTKTAINMLDNCIDAVLYKIFKVDCASVAYLRKFLNIPSVAISAERRRLCFVNKCLSLIDFKQVMSVYAFNCVHRLYTCKYVI